MGATDHSPFLDRIGADPGAILALLEFLGPPLAERRDGGTPWHAHHIAERYSLFALIALGEGIVGTVAALSAAIEQQGWSLEVALVGIAGTGLTFGLWWVYYLVPSAPILQVHRHRALVWSYGQMLIAISIVATGAGLHGAAYFIDRSSAIGPLATVLGVAVPVGAFLAMIYTLSYYLVRRFEHFAVWLLTATGGMVAVSVIAALAGVSVARSLVILMLAPAITVAGYEVLASRRRASTFAEGELVDLE